MEQNAGILIHRCWDAGFIDSRQDGRSPIVAKRHHYPNVVRNVAAEDSQDRIENVLLGFR